MKYTYTKMNLSTVKWVWWDKTQSNGLLSSPKLLHPGPVLQKENVFCLGIIMAGFVQAEIPFCNPVNSVKHSQVYASCS